MLSIVTFVAFPPPLKVYGFGVAIGVDIISVVRGWYETGTISLITSVVLAEVGLGL